MTETTPDCCEYWPRLRPYLKWFEFVDEPNVYVMPLIRQTNLRVNFCPVCGKPRRSTIWNRNTHPEAV